MSQSQISQTTIVVRGGKVYIPPGGGVTRAWIDVEWLKKHGSRRPLFRPKPRKKRQ